MDQKGFSKFWIDLKAAGDSLKSESFAGMALTFSKKEIQKRNNFELPFDVLNS
jgi:hypothetical protein